MKKIITASLVASLALTSVAGAQSLSTQLNSLEAELAEVKEQLAKQNTKINKVKAHDAGDNIKWGVDLRTAVDSINYDLADGSSRGNDSLMGLRLWLNMAYAADSHNIFKGRLSMNKAFGADFGHSGGRSHGLGEMFDWTGNTALADSNLKVSQAYWLYLGEAAFGLDMPWTFSVGRRPSTNGFLANLREDDPDGSPLAHVINVEFDGLSSKLDLSNVTGISGMSFKVCMGRGSTSATPLFETATPYADDVLENIDMAGIIFEPYNDGQFIVKSTWYRAFNLPGMEVDNMGNPTGFKQYGDIDGAALSVLVDGITEDGYFADAKVFGSFAWTGTNPDAGQAMLGADIDESESGTSYWIGAYLPVGEGAEYGTVGLEYNHGSQYWRPFTYAEDTMIGSKIAVRGDAWEANYTYQINDALSVQARYTDITYDYAGSQGFFGNTTGNAMSLDEINANANWGRGYLASNPQANPATDPQAAMAYGAIGMEANTVAAAQDFRFYLRYRF